MGTMFAALGHAGWGWGWGWIFPLAWIVLIALFWALAWRGAWWRRGSDGWHDGASPQAVLGERYARGEIDEVEYRKRLEVLKERRP